MHVEAFVLLKPRPHFGMLVRGVVVDDQMQLKMLGRFAVDLFEKLQPFLMPMLALNATYQFALDIIQRCERGDGAMTDIIVRLRADMPDSRRQFWLGALESLNVAFFIATKYQCLIREIQIQPNCRWRPKCAACWPVKCQRLEPCFDSSSEADRYTAD